MAASIKAQEREIGDLKFVVEPLPYFAAQHLFTKLCKLAGAQLVSLAVLVGALGGNAAAALRALAGFKVEELVPLLGSFFDKLDPEQVEALTKQILQTTRVWYQATPEGEPQLVALVGGPGKGRGVMDAVIGGDFWTGLAVQGFALSVFFGNFSSARGVLGSLGQTQEPSTSPASTTSTGGKEESWSGPAGAP